MSEKHIAELTMPYSAIGKRGLPAGIRVIGILPQNSIDMANDIARFLIEGAALPPYFGPTMAVEAFDMDKLEKRLSREAA